jgi:hypothetical protein
VVWFAPSPLWNKAVRERGLSEMLCPQCFIEAAERAGIKPTAWEVAPEGWHEEETQKSILKAMGIINAAIDATPAPPVAQPATDPFGACLACEAPTSDPYCAECTERYRATIEPDALVTAAIVAESVYDALAANDDVNTWHKERILPMITDILSRYLPAQQPEPKAEVRRLREALRGYRKIVKAWQSHVLITSRLLSCSAIDREIEAAIDKLKRDYTTARADAIGGAIEAVRASSLLQVQQDQLLAALEQLKGEGK